jgi:hypothetical protein
LVAEITIFKDFVNSNTSLRRLETSVDRAKIFWLLFIAIIVRVILYVCVPPNTLPDTADYEKLAIHIQKLDMAGYDGQRTPVFPLVMVLGNLNFCRIEVIQLCMGVIISLALFWTVWLLIGSSWTAFFGGLTYTIFWPFPFAETWVLSESTTMFFLVLTFLMLARFLTRDKAKSSGRLALVAMSVCSALAALTRPVYLLVSAILVLYLLYLYVREIKAAAKIVLINIAAFVLPAILLVGGWSVIIYQTTGTFGVTTLLGYNLTNVVGGFMEDAPDKYATLRDIYLTYRAKEVASTGAYTDAIWFAIPDMEAKTGLSFADLSKQVKAMCIDLIKKEPLKYARRVSKSWKDFWYRQGLDIPYGKQTAPILNRLAEAYDRLFYSLFELIFLLFPVVYFGFQKMRKKIVLNHTVSSYLCLSYATLALSCISIGMVESGTARYSTPTRPIMMVAVVIIISQIVQSLQATAVSRGKSE